MHNYDVYVNGEYTSSLRAWSHREAEDRASDLFGAYGTVTVKDITEQQAWERAQEWML